MSQANPTASASLGLPRRVARKLLRGAWGRRARHVLDVGCGNGQLVAYLQRRGCLAAGIDENPATQGTTSAASIIHRGSIAGGFPFKPQSFDLILVRSSRIYSGDLNTPEAFTATANLLSSLKPRRRAIFLEPSTVEPGVAPDTARMSALETHLACFPGHVDVSRYHDGIGRFLSFEWLLGRNRNLALALVVYTAPRTVLSRLKLHQQAREAVLRLQSERAATRAA